VTELLPQTVVDGPPVLCMMLRGSTDLQHIVSHTVAYLGCDWGLNT